MEIAEISGSWLAIIGVVVGGVIGISGNVFIEILRSRSQRESHRREVLGRACVTLQSQAMAFVLSCQQFYLTSVFRSGLHDTLDTIIFRRQPMQPLDLLAEINVDLKKIFEAHYEVDLWGSKELIHEARVIVGNASDIMAAWTSILRVSENDGKFHGLVSTNWQALRGQKRNAEKEQEASGLTRELARSIVRFATVARRELGVTDPDSVRMVFDSLFSGGESTKE